MRIPVHQLSRLLLELYEDILDSTNKGEVGRNNGKQKYNNNNTNQDTGYDRHDDDGNEVDNDDDDDLQSVVLFKSYREQES